MVMEGEQNGLRPRNGVHCKVTWTQGPASETQVEAFGEYNEEFEQSVFISPEYKVPRVNSNLNLDWTKNEELHPFWFIKRCKPLSEDIPNMELVYFPVQQVLTCDFVSVVTEKSKRKPITEVALIQYPCLVNTGVIEPGSELILKWEQLVVKAPAKQAKAKTSFDQLEQMENKAKRAKQAASAVVEG